MRHVFVALCGLCWSGLLGVRPVQALGISINQPVVQHSLSPGKTIQGSMELVSHHDVPVHVSVYLEDWQYTPVGDGSKQFAPAQTLPRSCAGWVRFFPAQADLPPHGRAVVDYTIHVPDDQTLEGSYYAVLFFEATLGEAAGLGAKGSEDPEATVRFAARLGSLMIVDIEGTVRREARLSNLRLAPTPSKTVSLTASLVNEGNVHLRCEGSFHVLGEHEVVMGRGELPARYVWLGTAVPVEAEWSGTLSPGMYTFVATYDCGEEIIVVEEAPLSIR